MQKSQPIVILIIIAMAIILAAGLFLALNFIQNRPDAPKGTLVTTVEGIEVTINMDPAKEVRVLRLTETQPDTSFQTPEQELPAEEFPVVEEPSPSPTEVPPTPVPVPTTSPEPVIFIAYTVVANDSLYSIANRFDTSIALMARFGIAQDDLVPGSVIQLPVGNPAYCPVGTRPYAVGEGDTAFSIGHRFSTTADELRAINNLDANYTIYGASIICVPGP